MSRFYRLVGRQPMSKSSMQFSRLLVRIYKIISLENCMELSGVLSVQPICIWSWLQARVVVETSNSSFRLVVLQNVSRKCTKMCAVREARLLRPIASWRSLCRSRRLHQQHGKKLRERLGPICSCDFSADQTMVHYITCVGVICQPMAAPREVFSINCI